MWLPLTQQRFDWNEEDARRKAEAEAKRKAEEEAKRKAEEARRKVLANTGGGASAPKVLQ